VWERGEPAAVELDARRLALAAHPARCLEDHVVREHVREPVDVVSVEGVRPPLKSLAGGHRHDDPPSIDEPACKRMVAQAAGAVARPPDRVPPGDRGAAVGVAAARRSWYGECGIDHYAQT